MPEDRAGTVARNSFVPLVPTPRPPQNLAHPMPLRKVLCYFFVLLAFNLAYGGLILCLEHDDCRLPQKAHLRTLAGRLPRLIQDMGDSGAAALVHMTRYLPVHWLCDHGLLVFGDCKTVS